MNSVQQEELNHFFVETFNKTPQYEEATLSVRNTSGLSMKELYIPEAAAQMQARQENTMSKVTARLGISVGALTTAVGMLIAREYLEHRGCEQGHRVVWITLTPKRERAEWQHRLFHHDMVQMIGDSLSEERLCSLSKSLKTLSRLFEGEEEDGMTA